MAWGEKSRPLAVLPTELERAIRRDERAQIRAALEGDDLRRCMRVLSDRLAGLDRDDRQQAARQIPGKARRALLEFLGPDLRRLCLLLAALLEPTGGDDEPEIARFDRLQAMPVTTEAEAREYLRLTDPRKAS